MFSSAASRWRSPCAAHSPSLQLAGGRLSGRYRRALARYRYGPGVFKLDWALDGPIPWTAPEVARAGTVHLGGRLEELVASEGAVTRGEPPARPFVLLVQSSLSDASRAPAGKHTARAYCHVPNGSAHDMTADIEAQVERFAPGFRDLIAGRCAMGPAEVEARNLPPAPRCEREPVAARGCRRCMKRTAIAAALTCVALAAPAAHAKGPHASVDPGPQGLRPGQPWVATLTLVELRDVPAHPPTVVLRSGDRRFAVRPVQISAYDPADMAAMAEARYRLRTAFPSAGRWTYTVVDGKRRYRFPAARIGDGVTRVRTGHVAFAAGSHGERAGGGGPIVDDLPQNPPGGDALPPEVIVAPPQDDGGGGLAPWVPAAGLALAGAAAIGWRRRR